MRPVAAVLCALLALPAAAEDAVPRAEEFGYYERCFGVPQEGPGQMGIGIYGEMPLSDPGHHSEAPVPTVPSSGDNAAWLVIAVIAVAILPIVVYSFDSEPPPLVRARFLCPTFSLDAVGGAQTGSAALGGKAFGISVNRFTFGWGPLATDFQFELAAPGAVRSFASHLILRPPPRSHVEGGLALGYRRAVFQGQAQEGLEVGLPHRYVFWRDGLRTVGLDLRPMLLVTRAGVEPGLEGAFLFPLHDVLQLRVGAGVFTFGGALFWTAQAGLGLTL